MKTEYELKILDIDVDKIKQKLQQLGAEKKVERNMRRFVYDIHPDKKHTWIRLRDNGLKTTLTIKDIQKKTEAMEWVSRGTAVLLSDNV